MILPADQWADERRYWRDELLRRYTERFGLSGLHPLQDADDLVPTPDLVGLIQSPHMATPDGFWGSSFRGACLYLDELAARGVDLRAVRRMLDFGLGFGRLLVNYLPFGIALHGCDATPQAVAHCRRVLPSSVALEATGLEPPLPYEDGFFEYVYANSVFTHVPFRLQAAWIREIARILAPGGCAIVSVIEPNVQLADMPPAALDRALRERGWFELSEDQGVRMIFAATLPVQLQLWRREFESVEVRPHFKEQTHLICLRRGRPRRRAHVRRAAAKRSHSGLPSPRPPVPIA